MSPMEQPEAVEVSFINDSISLLERTEGLPGCAACAPQIGAHVVELRVLKTLLYRSEQAHNAAIDAKNAATQAHTAAIDAKNAAEDAKKMATIRANDCARGREEEKDLPSSLWPKAVKHASWAAVILALIVSFWMRKLL